MTWHLHLLLSPSSPLFFFFFPSILLDTNPYKRGKVHPFPPPPLPDHFMSLLPAAILSLTAALSPGDRQVIAYLVSCCPNAAPAPRRRDDHVPSFGCNCFWCYISYWVHWDASPNCNLIYEIIEAYEEDQLRDKKKGKKKKKKKVAKKRGENYVPGDSTESSSSSSSGSSSDAVVVVVELLSSFSDDEEGVDQLEGRWLSRRENLGGP